jgi:hypothetical protein
VDTKVACRECQALILPATAEETGGLCLPCKKGYRKNIENSVQRRAEERRMRHSPEGLYWAWLVKQLYGDVTERQKISEADRLYFAVRSMVQEVINGGFDQYFFNSASDYFDDAHLGLSKIGAHSGANLVIEATQIIFGHHDVPKDQGERREFLQRIGDLSPSLADAINLVDRRFYSEVDAIMVCLQRYADEQQLFARFPAS